MSATTTLRDRARTAFRALGRRPAGAVWRTLGAASARSRGFIRNVELALQADVARFWAVVAPAM